jgi:hypothetical protein
VNSSVGESSTSAHGVSLDPAWYAARTPTRVLRGRNLSKADILVYECGAGRVALKDYGRRPFLVRHTLGRWFTRREVAAYLAADGIPGIARCHGAVGPYALALGWVDATPLARLPADAAREPLFAAVESIVAALHARGIALGDVHHRDVLVAGDGAPHLVDFATAWVAGPSAGPLRRAVFRWLRDVDRVAVARMRARWTGADERAEVLAAAGRRAAGRHAFGRRIKRAWDALRRRT